MDIYMDFINEIGEAISKTDAVNAIVSVYVGGSVARGDYLVNASDIDLYIVVNEEANIESISNFILGVAHEKLAQLFAWCPDGVTVAFTYYNEVKAGTSWLGKGSEYYSFQETGKLLYGKDIKQDISAPTESDIFKTSEQAITMIKQLVQQDVSNVISDRYFVRGVFGAVFSAMYFHLCLNKIYIRGKEKVTTAFNEINLSNAKSARNVLCLWNTFSNRDLTICEINSLLRDTKSIVCNI